MHQRKTKLLKANSEPSIKRTRSDFDRGRPTLLLNRGMLTAIGENPAREGLLDTPNRAAKAMMFFTKGYEDSVSELEIHRLFAQT